MFEFWVVWRYMRTRKGQFFNLVSILAIAGMVLGVAALVVVMSVVSGFESTLKNAVVDVTGHVLLLKKGEPLDPIEVLGPRLKKIVPQIQSVAPFVHVEGVVAHNGRIASIIVEGFDPETVGKTLKLAPRIVSGKMDLGTGHEEKPPLLVGIALAEKLGVKVGDDLTVVLPKNAATVKVLGFATRLKTFRVSGIVDLGMYEYDTRFMMTSAKAAQDLAGMGNVFTGLRIKLTDDDLARDASLKLNTDLGLNYVSHDWYEVHRNLFDAIKLEKPVIFVILLFMTISACFNISSTLFVSVLRRYGDISVLKTLGATRGRLVRFFSLQGLVIGALGSLGGLIFGSFLCLIIAKTNFIYVPAEIYHVRHLPVEMRMGDLALILLVSLVLCFLSTLAPALRGAGLNPVEGLKYD